MFSVSRMAEAKRTGGKRRRFTVNSHVFVFSRREGPETSPCGDNAACVLWEPGTLSGPGVTRPGGLQLVIHFLAAVSPNIPI